MPNVSLRHGRALAVLLSMAIPAPAEDPADVEFFEKKIRPVLVEHCYRCHAADAKRVRGGLLLDSAAATRTGGESGAAVVPGDPDESLLLQAIRYESFEMPPDQRLPEHVIADFEHWIRAGAVDPREGATTTTQTDSIDPDEGREFWSFRPRVVSSPPTVVQADWPYSNIDRYLLARMEAEGMSPTGDTTRETLIRRAYLALIGLPPTPEEIDAFLVDPTPTSVAFARVVDHLLDTKQYGERWGRHWLDVVRFAESSGGGRTLLFPDAWRYRDYVIEAVNRDLPFDQFVRAQLAGDLLPAENWQHRRDQLVATSFLVLGPTNYELQDKNVLEMDIVDEQLDTLGKALLGMTIGCARCHDHKFDPIPTRDYYALAGIFKSTKSVVHSNVSAWNRVDLPMSPDQELLFQGFQQELAGMKRDLKAKEQVLAEEEDHKESSDETADTESKPPTETGKTPQSATAEQISELKRQIKALQARIDRRPRAMAVADKATIGDEHIAIRGVVANPGELVPRGVLQVACSGQPPLMPADQSGRLELADWIVSPENPLTARVIVNRVWYWLFGQGLVRTVDNFGSTGEPPSHPELLDYLAELLIEDGWSIKQLIRRIVLSHVYQLDSQPSPAAGVMDPGNRLLSHMNRRRLEAETIRDTLLFLAGKLDRTVGGSNIKPGTTIEYGYEFDSTRRSVYMPVFRNALPEIFATFDFADPNIQSGRRTTSTIAPQALLLMNHPFVIEQCRAAAERLLGETTWTTDKRITWAFRAVLGRPPLPGEATLAKEFVDGDDARWSLLFQTLFQTLDFRYVN